MTEDRETDLAPDAWGIHARWIHAAETVRQVLDETVQQLRDVIGAPPDDLEERVAVVTRPGLDPGLGAVYVTCEDGQTRHLDGPLPADFPLGYHQLRDAKGRTRRLIVSPGRCWLPDDWRGWGWTVQLYAARSRRSWGIGDLADLRQLRQWSQDCGAGFLLVNPLHAVAPTLPQEASPYLPTTRRFRNPIYLAVEDVAGFDPLDQAAYLQPAQDLTGASLIDRDAIWTLKRAALWEIFTSADPTADPAADPTADASFADWRDDQGPALQSFAVWCALAEEGGPDWRSWREDLHDPDGAGVTAYVDQHPTEITFHVWLQWLLALQLDAASGHLPVLQDLPIGVDGGGADAWVWQHVLAEGVSVGAPPDLFNAAGQDWGSPPWIPWQLRLDGYQPFVESIRATMASGGGLRIDHVMGLFRLWWVPPGESPAAGAYVRYPSEDLLDIVALESHRAQAIVVGEDLGTVESGVREALADHDILSYRLLWFEADDPQEWPALAMAAVTTHDLPTVAGLWSGSDVDDQLKHTASAPEALKDGRTTLLAQLTRGGDVADGMTAEEAVEGVHRRLAGAPSILVSATLHDAVAEERRPNIPGSGERPNWCLPLPVLVDDLPSYPLAVSLIDLFRRAIG